MILDLHTHSDASEDSRAPVETYLKWLSAGGERGLEGSIEAFSGISSKYFKMPPLR